MPSDLAEQRRLLAERIKTSTHIDAPGILAAFAAVPRHEFLSKEQQAQAYEDRALPLDEGQTVSQPSMIAIMLAELDCGPTHRALEVGAGSGYAAALLGQLVARVYAVELRPNLASRARSSLARVGVQNVYVVEGDGSAGLPAHAPYDRILVSAAPREVPEALVAQLAIGGKMAIPVGDTQAQTLLVAHKIAENQVSWQRTVPCIFVPLVRG